MDTKQPDYGSMHDTSKTTSSASGEAGQADQSGSDPSQQKAADSTTSKPAQSGPRTDPRAGLPPGLSLARIFRFHMGIEHDEYLVPPHLAKIKAIDPIARGSNHGRRAVNLGIYNRAIREESGTHRAYWIWSFVTNAALGLQIIFAALLTALGAGHGPSNLVAVFGALNTIIAGFLTYLKGTGLPMRMKYFYNQWLKLRMYIEQRERDFASDDFTEVHRFGYTELMDEIEIIEHMYSNIRKDIEKHEPDSFAAKGNGDTTGPGEGASAADLAKKGLHAIRNEANAASTGAGEGSSAAKLVTKGLDALRGRATADPDSTGKGGKVTVSDIENQAQK